MLKLLTFAILLIASQIIYAEEKHKKNLFEDMDLSNFSYGGWVGFTHINKKESQYLVGDTPEFGVYGDVILSPKLSASGMLHYDTVNEKGRIAHLFGNYEFPLWSGTFGIKFGRLRTSLGVWSDYQLDPSIRPTIFQGTAVYPVRLESDIATDDGFDFSFRKHNWELLFKYNANSPDEEEDFMRRTFNQPDADLNTYLGSLMSVAFKWRPSAVRGLDTVFAFTRSKISDDIDAVADQIWLSFKYERKNWIASFDWINTQAKADVEIPQINYYEKHDVDLDGYFAYISYAYSDKLRTYVAYDRNYQTKSFNEYIQITAFKRVLNGETPENIDPKVATLGSDKSRSNDVSLGFIYNLDDGLVLRGEYHYVRATGYGRLTETSVKPKYTDYFGFSILKLF